MSEWCENKREQLDLFKKHSMRMNRHAINWRKRLISYEQARWATPKGIREARSRVCEIVEDVKKWFPVLRKRVKAWVWYARSMQNEAFAKVFIEDANELLKWWLK